MTNLEEQVTVLIPVYNRERYIINCIESIFAQTYVYFKVVVYDDGSTDTTKDKLEMWRRNHDIPVKKKLKINSSKNNRGIGYARNFLLDQIETPYACWMDSDDLMHPARLEMQLNKLKMGGYDIVFSYIKKFYTNRSIVGCDKGVVTIDVDQYSSFQSLISNTTFASGFFKRELQKYRFNDQLTLGGEDTLWIYSLVRANKKIGCVPQPLYFNRKHKNRIGVWKNLPEFADRKHFENQVLRKEIQKYELQEE